LTSQPEDRIGAYRLVRRLGLGGMGEVFLAWDGRLERTVAVKRMRRDVGLAPDTEARRERFRREARAAARLSHPHVVQIFDLVEAEEGSGAGDSIVMEYVQGRSLAELLRDGPLPPGAAVELARQVAEGLAAAHAQGLVHRDLKAENVMLGPGGQAKILDFGLARPLESGSGETVTDAGAVLGTYRAMSPEQAGGEAVDARSDLFSLGVLLYEMLAGRSPFQGRTPLETLRNVTGGTPLPLDGLPPELVRLVQGLLEKDPARRPPSAERVSAELRALAALPGLAPPSAGWALLPESHPDLGMEPTRVTLSATPTTHPSRRTAAVLLPLALIVLAAVLWFWAPWAAGEPVRVAVLAPVARAGGEALDLAAAGVLAGSMRTLLSLEGITAVDPAQIGEVRGGAVAVARAAGADEALTATLTPRGAMALLSLQRVRVADGGVAWAESVQVPTAPEDALLLASGVAAALRRAYPGHAVREGLADLDVRAADYAEFLRVLSRLNSGEARLEPELERLDAVTAGSPRFHEAHGLAAALALNRYADTRDPAHLARARAALGRARRLAPEAPNLLATEVRLALVEGKWAEAESLLAELERLVPGDVLVPRQRAQLAASRGRLDEAASWLRQVVERQPAWRDLLWLAELEFKSGEGEAARAHLDRVLSLVPGNTWALAKLGELELVYGDLRSAERIYLELVRAGPQRSDLTNLGLVRFLLGRYQDAVADYRRALALEPGHLAVTLNLADAEMALGRREVAAGLYRQVIATLDERERAAPPSPGERALRAQCLAQLGEGRKAVEIVLEALQASPEDADVAFQAALVFALAGERASALALTRKALDLGYQPRWFAIPPFEGLRSDPEFRKLISRRFSPPLPSGEGAGG
jgi:serine/threonine-protein kinase